MNEEGFSRRFRQRLRETALYSIDDEIVELQERIQRLQEKRRRLLAKAAV